jgi:CRISPR-associated helicase Cas3
MFNAHRIYSLEQVKEYFKEKGYNEEIAIKFYESYTVANWIDSKGNKVKNWKQKAINVWFREEHKIKSSIKYLTYEEILSNENYQDFINKIIFRDKWNINLNKDKDFDNERFEKQLKVFNDVKNNNKVIINAPAGSGKTIQALLHFSESNKKLLWVCPINVVSEALFDNILREVKRLGINASVELYLGNKRIICTNPELEEFSSDIVITNIDNFLMPTTISRVAIRQYLISSADVVFDEFHELLVTDAYYAGFVYIMRMRSYLDCKTLLLSATPSDMSFLWDSPFNKTLIYPSKIEHLPAIHNKIYNFKYLGAFPDIKSASKYFNIGNGLIFVNTIANSQILANTIKPDILMHSDFNDEDRKEKLSKINKILGKNGECLNHKIVSTQILEAAMDISTNIMIGNPRSIEAFMQELGRLGRWGEFIACAYILYMVNDKSNEAFIKNNYNSKLYSLFYKFILSELEALDFKADLNTLYKLYNKFYIVYEKECREFINQRFIISTGNLIKIKSEKSGKNEKDIAYSNTQPITIETLRGNTGDNIYFVCKDYEENSEKFYLFSNTLIRYSKFDTIHDYFDENYHTGINHDQIASRYMKILFDDSRFNYPRKYKKGVRMVELEKHAYDKTKPYISTMWWYSNYYGILPFRTIEKF